MRLELDGFVHEYDVQIGADLPGTGADQYDYPPGQQTNPSVAVVVEVSLPGERRWFGRFFGEYSENAAVNGCFACPDGVSLAIVIGGSGYVVRADQPDRWERVDVFPVTDVRASREAGVLVFADFTCVTAYGESGALWRSKPVSWDGIRITRISDRTVEGQGYDAPSGRECRFVIDVKTGSVIEGVSPPE